MPKKKERNNYIHIIQDDCMRRHDDFDGTLNGQMSSPRKSIARWGLIDFIFVILLTMFRNTNAN